jgi:tRNA-Thr(GGU) m(6)t(6)A37 methyltransferase TsaA
MEIVLQPIATVINSRKDATDDYWGSIISEIELLDHIPAAALDGIDQFSHLEIVFHFNQADPSKVVFKGHPRDNKDWPEMGIFAQRKKDRPNALGLTIVELVACRGRTISVRYLDAIDGTPVLDIKPVMKEFLPSSPIRQPSWSSDLMKDYWASASGL